MSDTVPVHSDTSLLHGRAVRDEATGATALPIYQTVAFAYDSAEAMEAVFAGRDAGYVYTRINNPTLDRLERRMNAIEGGIGAITCSSGMAAISATVMGLASAGDEIISGKGIFGGTFSLFAKTLKRGGITTRFADARDPAAIELAISDKTRLVFIESVGNPRLDVPDIVALSAVTRRHGVALVVDNTVATPALCRPALLGADIVVHSTSKFINGHGNSIGGVIVDCGSCNWASKRYAHLKQFSDRVREFAFLASLRNQVYRDLGLCMSPFNAFLTAVGLDSLAVRMERHCSNALAVANHLAASGKATDVRYPGLASHPDHAVAARQFGGKFGAILTIRLGTKKRCFSFINGLKLATNAANIGDVRTLVIHPASTFARDASESERAEMGISDDLVRLCIGIEHAGDLIADIDASLSKA